MNMSKDNKIAYVVLSCDPYSDIWDAYGQLFQRFWPDCPFDCFMASHHKSFDKYGFKPILLGDDISWSHGLLVLLDKLIEKGYNYGMIAFDDLMLYEKVDTNYIKKVIDSFLDEEGDCLRFVPEKAPKCYKHNQYFGKMAVKAPYRVTLGFTLWNLEVLRKITIEGESAWQFEKNATERSFDFGNFYCTRKSLFKFLNLIIKRKIDIKEYEKLKTLIPNASFDREQVYVKSERMKWIFLKTFLKYFPIKYQYSVYKMFSKPINI